MSASALTRDDIEESVVRNKCDDLCAVYHLIAKNTADQEKEIEKATANVASVLTAQMAAACAAQAAVVSAAQAASLTAVNPQGTVAIYHLIQNMDLPRP